jgi:hypothetical protein
MKFTRANGVSNIVASKIVAFLSEESVSSGKEQPLHYGKPMYTNKAAFL